MDKFNDLPKPVKQAIIGTSGGWVTGFALMKFGRYASLSISATILVLQLGHSYGYINVDWKSLNRDLNKVKKEVEKQSGDYFPDFTRRVQDFIKDNMVVTSTFVGGFLLGTASA